MLWLLLVLLSISGNVDDSSGPQTTDELVKRFLPKNAWVETLREFDPITRTETKTIAAKIGRMNGKNRSYIAFVYSTDDPSGHYLRLRVVQNPGGRHLFLDKDLPGTFLWMQNFKTNGLQLLDLNADGNDEIITITSEGASLGAYLNIFTIRQGKLESILTKPKGYEIDGYGFTFERGRDRKYRVRVSGKEGSSVQIYGWDGNRFKEMK